MAFRSNSVTVKRITDNIWEVAEQNLVYEGNRDTFVVPVGFPTDFATVPRVFTWLIPKYGKYTLAAVLHDYLCTLGIMTGIVSSRDADGIFRRVLEELEVPFFQRWLMWAGVRWGALFNDLRREGVWRDLPLMLLISLIALPIVLPAAIGIGFGLILYAIVNSLSSV